MPPQVRSRQPVKVSKSAQKAILASFLNSGKSIHSGNATTLQILIDYCESERVPYKLLAIPGSAYYIEKAVL